MSSCSFITNEIVLEKKRVYPFSPREVIFCHLLSLSEEIYFWKIAQILKSVLKSTSYSCHQKVKLTSVKSYLSETTDAVTSIDHTSKFETVYSTKVGLNWSIKLLLNIRSKIRHYIRIQDNSSNRDSDVK